VVKKSAIIAPSSYPRAFDTAARTRSGPKGSFRDEWALDAKLRDENRL
jgi:hypothetical protein